jgi:hypothetical protein
MLIEAAVAIGAGVAARSLSLIAFGADSLIELVSAGVLLWRLNVELRHGAEFPESVERRASRISAVLLFVLAAYVVVNAAYGLWRHEGQKFSTLGLILAVVAIPVMWWLARAQTRVADQIGSRALHADSVESITCGYLSGVVVLGLIAQLLIPGIAPNPEKEKKRCRLGSLSVSLTRALGHFARQIAIPKTVKDFHETGGFFCGKLGSIEVAHSESEHSEPLPKI